MTQLGIDSTLHSLRHYFASETAHLTKDVLLVQALLGHASLSTTQISMRSSLDGAQDRLAGFAGAAAAIIDNQ